MRARLAALCIATALLQASPMAQSALYWFQSVHGNTISVCFVGDAVTSRPERVNEVLQHIREFTYAANIKFDYLGACPASAVQANGNDSFAGDFRVVLPNVAGTKVSSWAGAEGPGPVPGKGCPMFLGADGKYCDATCNKDANNDGWGSWSNAPDDLAGNRACQYNLKLGDDPWNAPPYLNHALHEFGHGLGLAHEHIRNDVDKVGCAESGYGGGESNGFMTGYDKASVMHYMFSTCKINGNYDRNGLSPLDRLGLHILYPEDNRLAEYLGATLVPFGQPVSLASAWQARGANLGFVAKNFKWTVNNTTVNDADLGIVLPLGTWAFQYSYEDFLGRAYSANGSVRVLSQPAYDRLIGATRAAQLPLY